MNGMEMDAYERTCGMVCGAFRLVLRALYLSLLASLWLLIPARAQETGEPAHIDYMEALRIALDRSTILESAQNQVEQAGTQVSGARSTFFPGLTLELSGAPNYGRIFDQAEARVLTESNQSLSGRLSAGVTVFDGFSNIASLRQAQAIEEAAVLNKHQVQQDVVPAVISGFLDITAARQQVAMWEETLAAQEALEENVAILVEAGSRPISELYQQRASVVSNRSSLVDAHRAQKLADVALVQILRLNPMREYIFDPPAIPDVSQLEPGLTRAALIEHAFSTRADLGALESRLSAAQQSTRIASAEWWPSVSLSASYGRNYNSLSDFSFNDQLDRQMSGSVGLSISVPIFDRGHASRASTLALEYTSNRYHAGMATLLEVTQARASLVAASTNLINARYNLAFQGELLDYYLGELTEGL